MVTLYTVVFFQGSHVLTVKTKRKDGDRRPMQDSTASMAFRVKHYHIKTDGSTFYIDSKLKHGSLSDLVKKHSVIGTRSLAR